MSNWEASGRCRVRDDATPLLFPDLNGGLVRPPGIPDAAVRARALDIRRSFVVEAPAGSGKTGLLIQRYLKLLGDDSVGTPEQVLAITFTNKAAGEMRERVLRKLAEAREGAPVRDEFEQVTRELSEAVLRRDRQLGWRLVEEPHRINLRTIDSVCAEIARSLPVLSGAAAALSPVEDSRPLLAEAARRTLLLLGTAKDGAGGQLQHALEDVLLHRDNNLADCERLIAEMLAVRDQWGMLIPLGREALDDAFLDGEVLPRLEMALEEAICAELGKIADATPADVLADLCLLAEELSYLPGYKRGDSPLLPCRGRRDAPDGSADELARWRALVHLLVKPSKPRGWRKRFWKNDLQFELEKGHGEELKRIADRLAQNPEVLDVLSRVYELPPAKYPEEQWRVAKSLFRVLGRALIELQLVFAERGECDFTELSLLARAALGSGSGRDDLQSAMGARIEHLLVDEMQDTSSGQYELIERLTDSWDGHSQTVFLVGDPRQSIYLFRQAKLERFVATLRTERLGGLPLKRLRLTANFRSQRTLVEQLNEDLDRVFDETGRATGIEPIPFQSADPVLPRAENAAGLRWHARPVRVRGRTGAGAAETDEAERTDPELRMLQARRNARTIRQIAADWLERPLPAGRTEPWKIAVLVRNRRHLAEVVAALKSEADGGKILFRAVEIEPLGERQEILDLLAITRVLLHPADRAAGFAVLRAPWCGLSLGALHRLAGEDDASFAHWSVQRLMEARGELLSEEECRRMQRLWTVLDAASRQRGRVPLPQRVEFAWRSLGGDASLSEDQAGNARAYLDLLDEIAADAAHAGTAVDLAVVESRLERLFARPQTLPPGTAFVELLTMHRAKGLEWDVVMIPALERGQGKTRARLLTWAELASNRAAGDVQARSASPVMLAPIARRGEQEDDLSRWLRGIYAAQEAAERKRLFYVAATRARQELHLFASPDLTKTDDLRWAPDSLLAAAENAATPYLLAAQTRAGGPGVAKAAPLAPETGLELAAAAVYQMPGRAWGGQARQDDAEGTVQQMYSPPVRPEIERLPEGFDPAARFRAARAERIEFGTPQRHELEEQPGASVATRPEGSSAARALGNTVHALLELVAVRMRDGRSAAQMLDEVGGWGPRVQALLRSEGLSRPDAARLAEEAKRALELTLKNPEGAWVLRARAQSGTELSLSAAESGRVSSIRVDRIFRGGPEPGTDGAEYLWIVDYKTATDGSAAGLGSDGRIRFLKRQRELYAGQLERYAAVLGARFELPAERIRVALYYPLLQHLAWWIPGEQAEPDETRELTLV